MPQIFKFEGERNSTGRWRIRSRLELFKRLGDKCVCCGENHPFLLTFDHVNDDGKEHRSHTASIGQIYKDMLADPDLKKNYQVMCISCNFAKAVYGECPHTSGLTAEQAFTMLEEKSAKRNSGGFRGQINIGRCRWAMGRELYPWLYSRFVSAA